MRRIETDATVTTKRKGRPPKVNGLWDIPARLDLDPENPVRCLVHFVDGQARNLDCIEAKAGGDKLFILRRRGMVTAKMTIPLHHLFRWETLQLQEPAELTLPPTREVVSQVEPVEYQGETAQSYVVDKEKAKADFIRHARNNQKDYVAEEKVVMEAAKPLTGDTILNKAKGNS